MATTKQTLRFLNYYFIKTNNINIIHFDVL